MKTCSVEGCDKERYCKGLCCSHYYKERFKTKTKGNNRAKCKISGCENNAYKSGICNKHYQATLYSLEKRRKWVNDYFKTEKGKVTRSKGNKEYRARKRMVLVEDFYPKEIFKRDNYTCCICGLPINPLLQHPDQLSVSLEHKIPLSKGGEHSVNNCSPAHLLCNIRKKDKLISGNFEGASI